MKPTTYSRRKVLRVIGASIALPLLDVTSAFAQNSLSNSKNRLAYLYFPNGIPSGTQKKLDPTASY